MVPLIPGHPVGLTLLLEVLMIVVELLNVVVITLVGSKVELEGKAVQVPFVAVVENDEADVVVDSGRDVVDSSVELDRGRLEIVQVEVPEDTEVVCSFEVTFRVSVIVVTPDVKV